MKLLAIWLMFTGYYTPVGHDHVACRYTAGEKGTPLIVVVHSKTCPEKIKLVSEGY